MNFMNKVKLLTLILLPMVALSSCATIVNGSNQSISVCSTPSDAAVTLDNNYVGVTPMILNMPRNQDHIVRIELDGFEPYVITFSRKVSGWFFGNILLSWPGFVIDAITGAMYTLTPEQVQAQMRCNNMTSFKKVNNAYIGIVLKADPSWKKVGNLVAAE